MNERARAASLEDLKRLLAALNAEHAPYLLIGEPIRRALLLLPDQAANNLAAEWFEEGEGIRVADEIVVDLVFRTCGETYESLRPFEEVIDVDGVPVRTVNLEGLLRTKQSSRALAGRRK